jgi:outer membrane murein-binding lipoprotein Lpp
MTQPSDLEARVAALEARIEEVAADAAAARHLAAARDRDLADLGVKVDAHRSAINALSEQTAARFTRLDQDVRSGFAEVHNRFAEVHNRFAGVDNGFAEMRGKLDQAAAGQQQIVELLNTLIDQQDGQ